MEEMLGFVTVDYSAILEVEERTMETLSLEGLAEEIWGE
jgi:hypothetical protein